MTWQVMSCARRLGYPLAMTSFPALLRRWRATRQLTQASLAADAEVSQRHLSCVESGKARPSRQLVLVLGSALELDLRDRNALLLAAGFAPVYAETPLGAAEMSPLRQAIDLLLTRQEPYGAVVVDRRWDVITMNQGAARLMGALMPEPPSDPIAATNLVHTLFHPDGLRPVIVNWEEVAWSIVARLHREVELLPDDPHRADLLSRLTRYPGVPSRSSVAHLRPQPFLTLHLRRGALDLRLFTVLTSFGTPLDVTAQELTVETFFPADPESDATLRALAADQAS